MPLLNVAPDPLRPAGDVEAHPRVGVRRPPVPELHVRMPAVRRDLRSGLIVPTLLVLSSFGPACGGDDQPPTTATDPASTSATTTPEPTTTADTTGTTRDTTAGESTAGSTDTGSDTTAETGDELPDCSPHDGDQAACTAAEGCYWLFETSTCVVNCNLLTDQATCDKAMICFWSEGYCYPPI